MNFGYERHSLGTCPKCGFATQRIPRRWIDRLISRVTPVERYMCMSPACDWVGNIKCADAQGAADPAQP